ncbi:plasmid recombination protein [Vibrio parahaemolyticus]|uniref:plasmid recombination protein n=1 Tax=Vibrio parahaemolyticus TaxID=670 RepID=UPI001120249A|nr:plasmid recombination protein [Vibrio parahaemolyticus]TOZ83278.1 hypothetical protein DXJ95_22790 [Vibrio parahaemolyticus]
MGYQFIHIETYGKESSRTNKKQSAQAIAAECERLEFDCLHVETPLPPINIFGCRPSEAVKFAENQASVATDSIGRKLRKDAQIILAGVVSYPIPVADLDPQSPKFKRWLILNHNFLKQKYGSQYKSLELHRDETYPHCHFIVVPALDSNSRMNIGDVHQGIYARDNCNSTSAKQKIRAYKEAMRQFQDEYYQKVAREVGLTRSGPRKRRLSRKEWMTEKSTAKLITETINKLSARQRNIAQKEKQLRRFYQKTNKLNFNLDRSNLIRESNNNIGYSYD